MSQQAPPPSHDIQANLVRASRFADGRTRDWSLFFFFRVMAQAEFDATLRRITSFVSEDLAEKREKVSEDDLVLDFQNPSLLNAGLWGEQPPESPGFLLNSPFHNWLKALVSACPRGLKDDAAVMQNALSLQFKARAQRPAAGASASASELLGLMGEHVRLVTTGGAWARKLKTAYGPAEAAGLKALQHGLLGVIKYEILRQGAPAFLSTAPTIRGESAEGRSTEGLGSAYDPTPSNIAFSWNGLRALGVDPATLDSFPEPFRDGMALRADRLHDTGPSSPAGWEGPFGLSRVHGYFTSGFLVGGKTRRVEENLWRRLRRDVAAFNAPEAHHGLDLRAHVGALFRPLGLEILHIELGQDPYDVHKDQSDNKEYACPRSLRVEHFGFRDGLSQPFADLKLKDPWPGQGTPSRSRTWSPVAPGELYLDLPDEDGAVALLPVNANLRRHGTYVVFRKLEQDVVGFRSFLGRQTRGDEAAADRLAAEFVGRWRSGTPLVRSPDTDRAVGENAEGEVNDFLFASDDPKGAKCPLGAHIRRANPRDTGGRNEARRHRLLRRSISYGGPLLPSESLGDGEPRGLLFVAMNARLDQQFEVIQADWLNSGEFLGQAGLGRCPLVGDHSGGKLDGFLRAGEVAPLTGIPSFVTMRGGEYFFAPGISALKALGEGQAFPPDRDETPHSGFAMGKTRTQGLFDPERLFGYGVRILTAASAKEAAIKVNLPLAGASPSERMVFVGRYRDVVQVLSGGTAEDRLEFSVKPYHESAQRITRGQDLLISTDAECPMTGPRARLRRILDAAWRKLQEKRKNRVLEDLRAEANARLAMALRRCGPAGRIDLVDDLAVSAAYGVVSRIYGVPGPDWVTELAVALPFGKQHLSELSGDWLKALKSSAPSDPGVISLQIWSAVMLGDVIANLQSAQEAWPLSRQAGGEMLSHIDGLLSKGRADAPPATFTLVDAFVANAEEFAGDGKLYEDSGAYLRDAAVLLAELTANTLAATPSAFGGTMQFLLQNNMPIKGLAARKGAKSLTPSLAKQVIYECDRLNPVLPVLQRLCTADAELSSKATVSKGDRVAALVAAANLDEAGFQNPSQYSLNRPQADYLMFGVQNSGRQCWGQDIAMEILTACLGAAASLKDLRGIAGKAGGPRKALSALTIALPARFTPGHA